MNASELAAICNNPNGQAAATFAQIVRKSFSVLGFYQRDLARDFEVAESTVSRWASATAKPHSEIQRLVVAWIGKRAAKAATSSETTS